MKRCIGQDNCAALGHYSRRLSSLATRAICSHLHNKLNVASVVGGGDLSHPSPYIPLTLPASVTAFLAIYPAFLLQFTARLFGCQSLRFYAFHQSHKYHHYCHVPAAVAAFARRFTIRRHFALHCPTDSFCSAPPPVSPSLLRCLILAVLPL